MCMAVFVHAWQKHAAYLQVCVQRERRTWGFRENTVCMFMRGGRACVYVCISVVMYLQLENVVTGKCDVCAVTSQRENIE